MSVAYEREGGKEMVSGGGSFQPHRSVWRTLVDGRVSMVAVVASGRGGGESDTAS